MGATRRRRTRRPKQRGGSELDVIGQIMQFITGLKEGDRKRFQLDFTIHGIPYSTVLEASLRRGNLLVENTCIEIDMHSKYPGSRIDANIHEIPCFTPRLTAIREPVKISSTDVLQTLKTKLNLLFTDDIEICDIAQIHNVRISFFKMMRGELSLYEKYGYKHPDLAHIREKIATSTWDTIKSAFIDEHSLKDLIVVEEILKQYNPLMANELDTQPIMSLMRNVPFEIENKHEISRLIMNNAFHLTRIFLRLDVGSPEWQRWNAALRFTKFLEL
jgi:hypothetical protein